MLLRREVRRWAQQRLPAAVLLLLLLAVLPSLATLVSAGPTQDYPESRSLNDDVLWIAKVRMGNQRFNSKNDGDGYEDNSDYTFTLFSGTDEYLSLHPWYEPTAELPTYWLIWMDLNQDGDFNDTVNGTSELVTANPNYNNRATTKGLYQNYFRVPSGFDGLTTRMRITMKHKSDPAVAAPAPDEVFEYGEVEDYTVRLVPIPPAPPSPPRNVTVFGETPTFAQVRWDPVPGAGSYDVHYREATRSEWIKLDTFFHRRDATSTAITLATLSADTPYEVKVRVVNAGGSSEFSPAVDFRTIPSEVPAYKYPTVSLHPEAAPFKLDGVAHWRLWDPSVVYDEDDRLYKVWYTVWGGHEYDFYQNRLMGVGHAWSRDGLKWTRQPGGHIMVPTPDSWEKDGLETVSVVKQDGLYYMWYLGKNYTPYKLQLGLATSTDGVNWTKHPGNPVLTPEQDFEGDCVKEPSVLWDEQDGVFKMWYNGMVDRVVKVGYATSPDGVSWTKKAGPVNGDESAGWNHVHVAKVPGRGYQMYFLAGYSVFQAWSEDGINDWALNPNGPVLRARQVNHSWNGAKHDFENLLAYGSPSAVFRDGEIKLFHMRSWYFATEYGDNSMRFGLATGTMRGSAPIFTPLVQNGR